jgi:hypothetical protein
MIRIACTLLLLGYLPGALVLRLPLWERSRRESLEAAERGFWAVVLSSLWSLLAAFVLAAAGKYSLPHLVWASIGVVVAIAAVWRGRLLYTRASPPGASLVAPAVLIALTVWLYPPPSEYVLGGKDPGVYMNAGIQIAQRGGLVTVDETVASLPPEARPLFFPQYLGQPYYSPRFMGFFVLDPDRGTVINQFPHLYSVSIAIGYGVNGLTGARYASLAAAIFGVLALYFLAARIGGQAVGTVAAGLLAVHVIEVWYARYPNSEILTQALGLAGLLAVARAHVDDDGFFAPVAGVVLGLLPFARFDAVLSAGLAAAGVVLLWLTGRRLRATFLVPLVIGGVVFGAYLVFWLAPYAVQPLVWLHFHRTALAVAALGGVVVLAGAARFRRRPAVRSAIAMWTPRVLIVLALGLAGYAWFFRQPGGALAPHDAYAFRTFGWYVAPAALAAAAVGLAVLMIRHFWRDPSFFMVFIGMSWFVFYRLRIVPEHFWAARRFVPVILPGVMLALAGILAPATMSMARGLRVVPLVRQAIRLVLLALVAWSFWTATAPIRPHVEYAGVIARLERLAARFGPDDLLVVESRNASDLHVLGLPLAYIYARPVLVLATPKPDGLLFAEFLRWARARYRNVYFLGGGGTDLLSREVAVTPVAGERFQIPEYESLRNAYPTRVRYKEFDFSIYRFVDPQSNREGLKLDIGNMDDLSVVRFHAKERDARGTFRWTGGQSYLSLLGISETFRELVLWMEDGGRPAAAGPAEVEAFLGDTSLGRVRVGRSLQPYVFDIPPALAKEAAAGIDAVTIRLASSTWNPRALTGADDNRDLGVMVERVEVRPVAPPR